MGVQSGIDDPLNFFSPRIKTIEDLDGDGLRDILVMGMNRDYSGTAKIISSSPDGIRTRKDGEDKDAALLLSDSYDNIVKKSSNEENPLPLIQ